MNIFLLFQTSLYLICEEYVFGLHVGIFIISRVVVLFASLSMRLIGECNIATYVYGLHHMSVPDSMVIYEEAFTRHTVGHKTAHHFP